MLFVRYLTLVYFPGLSNLTSSLRPAPISMGRGYDIEQLESQRNIEALVPDLDSMEIATNEDDDDEDEERRQLDIRGLGGGRSLKGLPPLDGDGMVPGSENNGWQGEGIDSGGLYNGDQGEYQNGNQIFNGP